MAKPKSGDLESGELVAVHRDKVLVAVSADAKAFPFERI